MNNTIVLISVIVTCCFGALFLLIGMAQGFKRSIVSLVLVCLSVVLGIALTKPVSNAIIGDGKIIDDILAKLPSDYADYYDILIPLLKMLFQVVTCIAVTIACYVASIIVYCILKLFVRPGEDREGNVHKFRLLGGIIGVAQGLVISFGLLFVVCGLFAEVNKVKDLELNGNKLIPFDTSSMNLDYDEFKESLPGKVYDGFGGTFFREISSGKDNDNKNISLSGQVDALVAAVKMANELENIGGISFAGGLDTTNVNSIVDILQKLGDIQSDLDEESLDTLDTIIHTVAEDFDLDFDLSVINFATIDYSNEADIVSTLYSYQDITDLTLADAQDFVNTLAESTIILPLVDANDVELTLNETNKNLVQQAINEMTGVEADTLSILKALFAIA